MNWLKREATVIKDDLDIAIESEMKKIGTAAKNIVHSDILHHAADTVASLKAKAVDELGKVDARIREIGAEAASLAEHRRRALAVMSVVEKGLSDLEAASDAPDQSKPAAQPADASSVGAAVAAALAPAAE